MTINTTLDSFLYANTAGFNPDYGKITPRPSGSLISREINQNMEKLISIGHSIVITEDSETTPIEYNASFVIKTENATLKLGTAFQGGQVTIVFAENGYIEYTKAEGNTKEKYKKNTIKKITYNGLNWIDTTPLQIPETNLTCDTAAEEEFKIVKIETILQQGKIPNNIELNIDFTNANSFGETTAATPTYPKLKITNAADEELGIYTICDSRGHYAGKGCWNSGDTMTFKIKGTKACITNSDVRETTSDYTIYSDGSTAYKKVPIQGVRWSVGTFKGEVYKENGIKWIVGFLKITSAVSAYNTTVGSLYNTEFPPNQTVINFDKVGTSVKSSLIASGYDLLAHINLAVDDVILINVGIPDTD